VKRHASGATVPPVVPFSILERIDVGETMARWLTARHYYAFSILERIDVGETFLSPFLRHS